jgi:serine/threonine protein kinase
MDEIAFGRYRLIEVIGRGGMGTVYRAQDTMIDREVAIKVLPTELASEPGYRERFRREAHTAARLAEPHIVPIYDTGEIDGRLYLVMPVVDGVDLTTVLRRDGALQPAFAVRIIDQLAAALDAAHKRGLVHRDVKPSNALVTPSGFVYLIDFGIAHDASATKLTQTGMTMGTWTYMAPERFTEGIADARGDVYALACVLYECLTGRSAFPGDTLEQQFAGHLTKDPPKPSAVNPAVPGGFDEVIARGMAKDPEQRYQTAGQLAVGAHQALTGGPAPDPKTVPDFTRRPAEPISATQTAYATAPSDPTLYAAPPAGPHSTQMGSTQLAPPPGAPGPPGAQPPAQPSTAQPAPRPPWRNPRVLIGALAGVVLLIAGGIFAVVKLSGQHNPAATTAPTTAPVNPGPFTGTYRADMGAVTGLDGEPPTTQALATGTDTWGLRSACDKSGCVATASRLSGSTIAVPAMVFDKVGESWVAVTLYTGRCNDIPVEYWYVITLQPGPNGTLTGELRVMTNPWCREKQTVTFTRTGDADLKTLPDPATFTPRVVSPAAALHGRYHRLRTFQGTNAPAPLEDDWAVTTDCLRTGDRCMSYFHARFEKNPGDSYGLPAVFAAGNWTIDLERDFNCPNGALYHGSEITQLPLPTPPQDPITQLTGRGRSSATAAPCQGAYEATINQTFTRIGD